MEKNKNILKIAVIAVLVLSAAGVGAYFYNKAMVKKMAQVVDIDTFYDGISVNNVPLGGLTQDEAKEKLSTDVNNVIREQIISLVDGENTYDIKYGDIDAKYNIDDTLLAAYNYGRNGELKDRYKQVTDLKDNPKDFEAQFTYNDELLKTKINEISAQVKVEPENSVMKRENGAFVISDEKIGYEMDFDSTYNAAKAVIESLQPGTVEIKKNEIQPEITREENEKATSLIGTYYTTFSGNDYGRNENLRVGCANINGTELAPGEIFSMNEGLGPQTYENGYRDAAVIVDGKLHGRYTYA